MATDTLLNMVRALRAECGHSLSVAQGTNQLSTLQYLLQRTQIELWNNYVWPDLTLRVDTPLVAGTYLYPFPATMTYDQIRESWWAQASSAEWTPIEYGITENYIQPGGANTESGQPVQLWDVEAQAGAAAAPQLRVWPTPTAAATLRFKGNKPLGVFVADTDVSTLDWTAIVLFCSAELLARAKAEDAAMKLEKAQKYLLRLMGNKVSAKNKVSTLGAFSPRSRSRPTPGIDYIPMTS